MKFHLNIASRLLLIGALMAGGAGLSASDLVILHTNDTHSMIDPDAKGTGGVLQRKAIIDSVRNAEKNVLLVDAGDVVQGTLYFKFFGGDVEYPLMNMMDYDVQILGNHEFDNGLKAMADHYRTLDAERLSANYDFTGTPAEGIFKPYTIREIDGKRVGIIGLNIDPSSLIARNAVEGVKFLPVVETANRYAAYLKDKERCDLVVAVTHIGAYKENEKEIDYDLARRSKDIDIIIGGHSHNEILPGNASAPEFPSIVENAEGRPVLVTQTGKYGRKLGYIKIDLDDLAEETPADFEYRLIPVTDRFAPSALDADMEAFVAPYRDRLRAIEARVIGRADEDMDNDARVGAYPNWASDFAEDYGRAVVDSLRATGLELNAPLIGMMNVGGIRHPMKRGDVTEGEILATFPFSNRMLLMEIKGKDLIETMDIAAQKGGEGVSRAVMVVTDDEGHAVRVLVDDEEVDPEGTYLISTIDYLSGGNDDLRPLANGKVIWRDVPEVSERILEYVRALSAQGLPVAGDPRPRFVKEVRLQ